MLLISESQRDMDFDGPWHGRTAASRSAVSSPICGMATPGSGRQGLREAGFEYVQDQNGEFKVADSQISTSDAQVSAAIGYLDPGTRLRDNLTISP